MGQAVIDAGLALVETLKKTGGDDGVRLLAPAMRHLEHLACGCSAVALAEASRSRLDHASGAAPAPFNWRATKFMAKGATIAAMAESVLRAPTLRLVAGAVPARAEAPPRAVRRMRA